MFKKKTLLILGAGASKEAKLPTGDGLKNTIATMLNFRFDNFKRASISGDTVILNSLRLKVRNQDNSPGDVNPYILAAHRIRKSMPLTPSIDSFIDAHNGDKLIESCGKLAIVRSILEAEKNSLLYFESVRYDSSINYENVENTWFNKFYQILTDNCRKEDLEKRFNSLTVVIFNYDRCIEHFLFNSIQTYYGIDAKKAAELVKLIEIYHPYGKVGYLPWQRNDGSIDFGAEPSHHQLLNISGQIRTFTEGTDPSSSDISSIREQVKTSAIVIFLGFAFHKLNMKLLQSDPNDKPESVRAHCFATAKGISTPDCEIIKRELLNLKHLKTLSLRNDLTCSELFKEFRRSLSAV